MSQDAVTQLSPAEQKKYKQAKNAKINRDRHKKLTVGKDNEVKSLKSENIKLMEVIARYLIVIEKLRGDMSMIIVKERSTLPFKKRFFQYY